MQFLLRERYIGHVAISLFPLSPIEFRLFTLTLYVRFSVD